MNIKGANENALLDNLTAADLDERRRVLHFPASGCCGLGAVASDHSAKASNDDAQQRELAFNTSLYCVEWDNSQGAKLGNPDYMVRLLNHPANSAFPQPQQAVRKDVDYD